MISLKQRGDYRRLNKWLKKLSKDSKWSDERLAKWGEMGVKELRERTPKDTGFTASSWRYFIERGDGVATIVFANDNFNGGFSVALLIYHGHATRSGTYVKGIDYISPSIQPVLLDIKETIDKEVYKL